MAQPIAASKPKPYDMHVAKLAGVDSEGRKTWILVGHMGGDPINLECANKELFQALADFMAKYASERYSRTPIPYGELDGE